MELVLAFFKAAVERFWLHQAHEYFVEESGLTICLSSVMSIIINHTICKANQPKRVKIHPLRQRKARGGKLIEKLTCICG